MSTDPGMQATREVRERISRELGNDPKRLVEYYMEYQRQFGSRLRRPPDHAETAGETDAVDRRWAGR